MKNKKNTTLKKQNLLTLINFYKLIQKERILAFQLFFSYCFLALILLNIFNTNSYLSGYSVKVQTRLADKVHLIAGSFKKPSINLENYKLQNPKVIVQNLNVNQNFFLQLQLLQLIFLMQNVKPFFDKRLKKIAKSLKARLVLGSIKSFQRSMEKIKYEYNGDISKLNDILRSSLVFSTMHDIYQALVEISNNFKILRIKDRFKNSNSDYKDINLVVLLKNKLKAEIQLHLLEVFQAKKTETKIYERIRTLRNRLKSDPSLNNTKTIKLKLSTLENQRKEIYKNAWQCYKNRVGV